MSMSTMSSKEEVRKIGSNDSFTDAVGESQARLTKMIRAVGQLANAGRGDEARRALEKTDQYAKSVSTCFKSGEKKDQVYLELIEEQLRDLRKRVGKMRGAKEKAATRRKLTRMALGVAAMALVGAFMMVLN